MINMIKHELIGEPNLIIRDVSHNEILLPKSIWQGYDNDIKELKMSDLPSKSDIKELIQEKPDWGKDFITDIEVDFNKCYVNSEKEILQATLEESPDEEYLAEIRELDNTIFDGIDPTPQEILRDLEHIKNYTAYHGKLLERLQYLIFIVMVLNVFSWLV